LSIHFVKEFPITKVEDKKVPFKVVTVDELYENESVRSFVFDSIINPRIPMNPPRIITKMSPLSLNIIGLTTKIIDGVYLIQLNGLYPAEKLNRTLFHELAHVYQIERGMLIEDFGFVIWNGEIYSWETPYAQRPWEIHAEQIVEQLYVP
tara:strand:- start:271 stop:720 length:450 start_codon:yes stop_codon:yes gene_type:complete